MDTIEIARNIQKHNRKIIEDWGKAYLAELYESGIEIKPGCFVLNEQFTSDIKNFGKKYWFSIKTKEFSDLAEVGEVLNKLTTLIENIHIIKAKEFILKAIQELDKIDISKDYREKENHEYSDN